MTWAERLAEAVEAQWPTAGDHPAGPWLVARGVPQAPTSGLGLGVLPDLPYPDGFVGFAERHQWTASAVLVIRSWTGAVVGFQLRHPDIKNYIKFEVYDGARFVHLWGADQVRDRVWRERHLILAEGGFDALACRLAGGPAVATLSANPSKLALRWVTRLARRVTLLYDMDAAGRSSSVKVGRTLAEAGLVVSCPVYYAHDPWDLWRVRPAALTALVR